MPAGTLPQDFMMALQAAEGHVRNVTAAATLDPGDRLVFCTEPASSTYAITLAPLPSWAWHFVFVYMIAVDNGTVTVQDNDEGVGTDYASDALTAVGDYVLLLNVGGFKVIALSELTT